MSALARLREFGFKLNPSKCFLFHEKIAYLVHVVSRDGVCTDPEKISAVQSSPTPTSEQVVRSFVPLCSYKRRFIRNFSHIAAPLHALLSGCTKKTKEPPVASRRSRRSTKKPFADTWTPQADGAFKKLKEVMTCAPALGHPNFTLPSRVEINASIQVYAAVLFAELNIFLEIYYTAFLFQPNTHI